MAIEHDRLQLQKMIAAPEVEGADEHVDYQTYRFDLFNEPRHLVRYQRAADGPDLMTEVIHFSGDRVTLFWYPEQSDNRLVSVIAPSAGTIETHSFLLDDIQKIVVGNSIIFDKDTDQQ